MLKQQAGGQGIRRSTVSEIVKQRAVPQLYGGFNPSGFLPQFLQVALILFQEISTIVHSLIKHNLGYV